MEKLELNLRSSETEKASPSWSVEPNERIRGFSGESRRPSLMGYRTVAQPKFATKASMVTRRVWRWLTIFRDSENAHLLSLPKLNFSQKFPRLLFIESCFFWHRTCVLKNHEMIGREEITADERRLETTRLVDPAKQDSCFAKTRGHRKRRSSATEGQESSRQAALSRVPGRVKDLYISGSCSGLLS
jgi:hypothetical protein